MILKLIKLEFQNIGRFVEHQAIDFTAKGHLIQIDGKRLDYHGSSGSGKSTIFQANDYILGLNSIPATVLQSRKTKGTIWGKGTYLIGEENFPLTIERGKKEGLMVEGISPFTKEPIKISGNNEQAEEFIDQLLVLPRSVFKLMTHKRQKDRGFFLSMTPSQSYDFMCKALGLQGFVEKSNKIDEDIKQNSKKIESETAYLQASKDSLALLSDEVTQKTIQLESISNIDLSKFAEIESLELELKTVLSQIEENDSKLNQELASVLKPENIETQIDLSKINELKVKKDLLQKQISEIQSQQRQKIDSLNKEKISISGAIYKISNEIQKESSLKETVKKLFENIKHSESGKCFTCNQSWNNANSKDKLDQMRQELDKNVTMLKNIPALREKEKELKMAILKIDSQTKEASQDTSFDLMQELNITLREIEKENFEIQKSKDLAQKMNYEKQLEYNNKINEIKSRFSESILSLKDRRLNLSNKSNSLKSELEMVNFKRKTATEQLEIAKAKEKSASISLEQKEAILLDLNNKQVLFEESKIAIKKYVMTTLEETLAQIGVEATEKLSHISNMATTTVYFDSFKEKNGKIKEEITPYVSIDGDEAISLRSLSGGEESAINLAIDLAVVDIVEQRSGVGADYFVMDEPFEGLDTSCRQNCIELLKNSSSSKRILIVDHTEQVKEMIPETITAIRGDNGSYLQA
jgi:hypothetical protein